MFIATAVAWFYEGEDGGFEYWPDGPEQAPSLHEGRIFNTAIIGDNDRMFHRVRPTGDPAALGAWFRPSTVHDFDGDQVSEFAVSSASSCPGPQPA